MADGRARPADARALYHAQRITDKAKFHAAVHDEQADAELVSIQVPSRKRLNKGYFGGNETARFPGRRRFSVCWFDQRREAPDADAFAYTSTALRALPRRGGADHPPHRGSNRATRRLRTHTRRAPAAGY